MPESSKPELCNEFDILSENKVFESKVPEFVEKNLSSRFDLRYYQKEAIARLIYYLNDYHKRVHPTQLLYHMATGSGKTLIMAASILYLYKQGYNKFIFFVDSTDTIEKTKDNFLNKAATKYLFSEKISIDGKNVGIREVDNFEDVNEGDINILFSTIQGLHKKLNEPRENAITYEDFENEKIVLISDEAHHINALTKSKSKRTKSDKENIETWEGTVNRIFQQNSDNILLEYTATVELDHPDVKEKYDDKIIYQYPLKRFRLDRYSKEVEVLEGDFERGTQALQALIMSQYRRKVGEEHGLPLKPVLMMKSKNISMSEEFEEEFYNLIKNLEPSDLAEIKDRSGSRIIGEAFEFFEENDITLDNLVREFKEDFSEEKCISVNSKSESEEKQVLVNTLEDDDNQIRVVFAVDKLNEGWDVLNLFDIVRLYETRSGRRGKPGKTTIKEAQLIGRGARYWPFELEDNQDEYKRKYDEDVGNELRVLEELYYHCYNEPRYISELKIALKDTGIYPEEKKKRELKVKEDFKDTSFWKNGLIFVNEREQADRSGVTNLSDFEVSRSYKHALRTGYSSAITIFEEEEPKVQEKKTKIYSLSDFRKNIVRKALSRLKFYKFQNMQDYFPNLSSIKEFISSEEYLGSVEVEVTGTSDQLESLESEEKLEVAVDVCRKISREVKSNSKEYNGTKVFVGKPVNEIVEDKTRKFDIKRGSGRETGKPMRESSNEELRMDLSQKDWYVYNENYGTDQEKYFVRFLNNMISRLREKYDDVYLVRNEKLFQLYDFDDGRPLEPDFVLFLKEESEKPIHYQLFVEPKGEHLIPKDKWKEDFLKKIKNEHKVQVLAENEDYKIIGLPFYNEKVGKEDFKREFERELNLS